MEPSFTRLWRDGDQEGGSRRGSASFRSDVGYGHTLGSTDGCRSTRRGSARRPSASAALAHQPLNNLQLAHAIGRHPRAQHAAIGLVRPDLLQSDAARFGRRKHLLGAACLPAWQQTGSSLPGVRQGRPPSYSRAEWTTAVIRKPRVSVSRCRLRPKTFLPPSKPRSGPPATLLLALWVSTHRRSPRRAPVPRLRPAPVGAMRR